MINKEIKKQGLAFKRLIPYWKKSTFKKMNAIQRIGLGKTKQAVNLKEFYLDNQNNTRVCVYGTKHFDDITPVVIYFHGGGYAMGCPEIADSFYAMLIEELGVKVISPDYTLSLEKPFPSGFNDCYDTLVWVTENSELLNIDLNKVIIAGDSAGGGLCCAVSIKARNQKIKVKAQVPLYPMIDSETSYPSAKDNEEPVWNTLSSINAWELYLDGVEDVNCYASPSKLDNFENLPQALSFIGRLDPFLDEVKDYFDKMEKAGVKCELKVFEGCYHGFERLVPKAKISKEANRFIIDRLNDILK